MFSSDLATHDPPVLSTSESLKGDTSWEAVEAPKCRLRTHLLAQNTMNEQGVEQGKYFPSEWGLNRTQAGQTWAQEVSVSSHFRYRSCHGHTTGGE